MPALSCAVAAAVWLSAPCPVAHALLEAGTVTVDDNYVTVNLIRSYVSPVIVCTMQYDNNTTPTVVRVSNVTAASFDVHLVHPSGGPVAPENVSYLVVEEGAWTIDDVNVEAQAYTSTVTDQDSSWVGEAQAYAQGYANPVVLGQVMTENDAWSVFWCRGSAATNPPSATALRTGKTVCEDTDTTRLDETVGFIVFEAGHGTIAGVEFEAFLGADIVAGIDNAPPYTYTFTTPFGSAPQVAIATMAGVDGTNGGWAQIHGPTMASSTTLYLSIDEDVIGDAERNHTDEQVGYVVFEAPVVYPECVVPAECDDGLYCNGAEDCVAGNCVASAPIICDDGVGCTDDSCNEVTDSCDFVPNDANCDNGVACDGVETCDPALDCQPGISVDFSNANYSSAENAGDITITVELSAASCETITVDYDSADGTASEPGDYTAVSDTLVFVPGDTQQTFAITPVNDDLDEGDETLTVTLSNPSWAFLASVRNPATVTIIDDDNTPDDPSNLSLTECPQGGGTDKSPTLNLIQSDADAADTLAYTIQIDDTNDTFGSLVVDYTSDYIAQGVTSFTVGQVAGAGAYVMGWPGQELAPGTYYWRVQSDDGTNTSGWAEGAAFTIIEPSIDFSSAAYGGSEAGGNTIISVELSAASCETVTVEYATTDDTAVHPDDYAPAFGRLTFDPGETMQTFSVLPVDDNVTEGDETVVLMLANPSHAILAGDRNPATLVIRDPREVKIIRYTTTRFGLCGALGTIPPFTAMLSLLAWRFTMRSHRLTARGPGRWARRR